MATMVSSIVVGSNESVEERLDEIKRNHENQNHDCDVVIAVLNETTDGCAPGCKQVFYSLDIIHKD